MVVNLIFLIFHLSSEVVQRSRLYSVGFPEQMYFFAALIIDSNVAYSLLGQFVFKFWLHPIKKNSFEVLEFSKEFTSGLWCTSYIVLLHI